jgi:hypothetical protein
MIRGMQVSEIWISFKFYVAVSRQIFDVHLFDLKRSNETLFVADLAQWHKQMKYDYVLDIR